MIGEQNQTTTDHAAALPPRFIRCDNDPELTANALRDWCRFTGASTSYIDPGSPGRTPIWRAAPCSRPVRWSRTGGSKNRSSVSQQPS
jgi:hypothetical protein